MQTPTGQQDGQSHSIKDFAKEALHDLTHFDVKFFKTLKPLILKPGLLTTQALTPARNNYVKPLALFVFLNFVFFIFKSKGLFHYTLDVYDSINYFKRLIAENLAASHLSPELFTEKFNTAMKFEQQEYVVIMVPFFALFIYLMYLNKKRYFVEHLIFSLHTYSFAVIFLMLLPYIAMFINWLVSLTGSSLIIWKFELTLDCILFLVIGWYLYASLKRVYKQPVIVSIIKTLFSTAWFFFLIIFVYRYVLFFVVMHSVRE